MKKIFSYIGIIIFLLFAVSCSNNSETPTNSPETDDTNLAYTIAFNSNGYGIEPNTLFVKTNLPNPLPTLVDEDGEMLFNGWYLDHEFKEVAIAGSKITSDVTLFAKWEEIVQPDPEISTFKVTISGLNGGLTEKFINYDENQSFIDLLDANYNIKTTTIDEKLILTKIDEYEISENTLFNIYIDNNLVVDLNTITINADINVLIKLTFNEDIQPVKSFIFEMDYLDGRHKQYRLSYQDGDTTLGVLERNFKITYYMENHPLYEASILGVGDMMTDWWNTYIAIFVNDHYSEVGISSIPIVENMKLTFKETDTSTFYSE